ncbi:MAG TPA: GNAT family N-acetyltransferase [Candidatus Dormibacteraeota bacterium]|nr:GNAT family N-acetyltransferase [Candidatus Dormibacteraeota bacterium]
MILTSEAALTAISTSRIEASLALGRTSLGVVEAGPDLCWSISGIPVASFNAVVRCLFGPYPDRQIDDVQRQFAARAMPFVWWVKGREEELEKRLRNHGLDFESEESSGMALSLTGLPHVLSGPLAVSVERITERPHLRTWFATLLASFDATADDRTLDRATDVFAELSAHRANGWHFYLARIDGHPVGTSALHLGAAAGLYSVGTLPSVRRQGIGRALSGRALTDARSAGYAIATLTASEPGARLYEALGFTEYCRYREYVWRPPGIA